jgi:glycyl-tRNA synthetase beta chain
VLRARFNDAQFFWTADQKRSLVERVEDLKAVTFQAQLGSYHAKAERMAELIGQLCEDAQVRADAERAAMLAKCDLTTEMVGEFPELQGVVGGLYAAHQGEPQAVADAIYDHYKPAGPGDEVPRSAAGRWVSIADKLDTLRGMFGLGNIPTGSKDPFALRRAAAGVVRIVIEAGLPLTLDQLCGSGEHADKLREFFVDRLRHYLGEKGLRYDAINAVLAASDAQPTDVMARCEAIAKVRPTENFEPLAVSFKRIRNILEKAGGVEGYAAKPLEESRLEQGAEKDLFEAHKAVRAALQAESDYTKGLERIAALRPAVDRFFDDVLVMAKDEAVRENRLAFLARLLSELSTIADFSEIVSADE